LKKIKWAIFACLLFFHLIFPQAYQENKVYKNNIGITVGIPYISGLTYERTISSKFSVQGHVGYLVMISSIGMKFNWTPWSYKVSSYFFLGDALIDMEAEDYGDPEGIANYLWFGSGLSYSIQRFKIFVEVCGLVGGDQDKGLGDDWIFPFDPAIGGGVVFQF
jgi:hypothetical protein